MKKNTRLHASRMRRGWFLPTQTASIDSRTLKNLAKPNLSISAGFAILLLLSIAGFSAIGYQTFLRTSLVIWLPINLLVFVAIGALLRGQEGLVHAASHGHWHKTAWVNDAAGNALAALPVFSLVQRYRIGHSLHHGRFGSIEDPEFARYERLDLGGVDRSSLSAFAKSACRRLPRYFWDWWSQIQTTPSVTCLALLWHAGVVLALTVLGGSTLAILWLVYFVGPMLTTLTVIRFVDEAAEHQYQGVNTEFDATNNNIGPVHRWLLHPLNDGWHLVHHLIASVPFWNLKRAHDWLVQVDGDRYGANFPYRVRVLQEPGHGADRTHKKDAP